MSKGESINFEARPSTTFRLNLDGSADIIMIANGSGLGPFIGFLY
jgi:sulfite reductase alpha subunit-like flavoprotein